MCLQLNSRTQSNVICKWNMRLPIRTTLLLSTLYAHCQRKQQVRAVFVSDHTNGTSKRKQTETADIRMVIYVPKEIQMSR
jgi:hypothetical protein